MAAPAPLIGITPDVVDGRYRVAVSHAAMIERAGGVPIVLAASIRSLPAYLALCQGFVLTGGDDPIMETWGVRTHPKAKPVDPERQAFEVALLEAGAQRPELPMLGICLGMQLMGLHAGGALDQHLPETLPTAGQHWGRVEHAVSGALGQGVVHSHHRQALTDPGRLQVTARAPDGVIEAVCDGSRPFYVGVQWHPERTAAAHLGAGLFEQLVREAARAVVVT